MQRLPIPHTQSAMQRQRAMHKLMLLLLLIFATFIPYSAYAILSLELTRGVAGAIPIAIVPFKLQGDVKPPADVSGIVSTDLQNSGRFKVYGQTALKQFPSDAKQVSADYFKRLGTNNVVIGKVVAEGSDQYQVSVQLLDIFQGETENSVVLTKKFTISANEMRALAHHISDLVYEQLTGTRGIFSTKIAYVVIDRKTDAPRHYSLEVADQDGYNPRPLLNSSEPIMSPAWSPNGKQIAYVSFENKQAGIYVQNVATGARRLLSEFPGINGAPAWSHDGRRLALVLSKGGAPNIYIMDIATGKLTQVTHDFYINTEPAFAPDGKSLLYTSNRSGGLPQIYQVNLATNATSRVSFDGDYNARASFTRDGKSIAMIHRVSGIYNIAILNLDSGVVRVLNSAVGDSSSPSVAPNGTMILYDTFHNGRNVLGMVSSDGGVQLRMPARNGDAQDPAWSPFLS
jgi:TolB protein